MKETQVITRQRVADFGEVYTSAREVNAMLDLVKQETERIESRFLEPACGSGNFLVEVLSRKLNRIASRYAKSRHEYERYAISAVSSLYGIDILEDNVRKCRRRLFIFFLEQYKNYFSLLSCDDLIKTVKFILKRNIIWGDALTLQTVKKPLKPIIFAEWSFLGGMVKRRDFTFSELLSGSVNGEAPIYSDANEAVFIPQPIKEFAPVNYLKIWRMEKTAA